MSTSKYYAAGITAYVIWGFFSFVLKPLSAYPSLDILFYRVFSSVALMLLISMFLRMRVARANYQLFLQLTSGQRKKLIMQLLGGGIFLTVNWFSFIYVMNHISVNAASFAYLVCPILTTLLSFFLLKEKLLFNQWVAVLLSAVSCFLLSLHHLRDVFYSLLVALSFSLYLICQPKNNVFDKFLVLTIQVVCSSVLVLPFYPFTHGAIPTAMSFYLYICIIAVFFTIVPLWLNLFALKGIRSSALGILIYINPLINFGIAIYYYGETITILQALAYGIIFISVILFNMRIATNGHNSNTA